MRINLETMSRENETICRENETIYRENETICRENGAMSGEIKKRRGKTKKNSAHSKSWGVSMGAKLLKGGAQGGTCADFVLINQDFHQTFLYLYEKMLQKDGND